MLIYWSTHTHYSQSNEREQINQRVPSECLVLIRGAGNEAWSRTVQACGHFLSTEEKTHISVDGPDQYWQLR